jgi:hypothetical protein
MNMMSRDFQSILLCQAFCLVLVVLLALVGCETEEPNGSSSKDCKLSQAVSNPAGLLHSEPCETDDDCLYGFCHSSGEVATFKFCTKRCDCGPGSQCSDEDGGGKTFTCQKFNMTSHPDEVYMSICTQKCTSVDDCPSEYNACRIVTGVNKVCVFD